MYRLLSLRPRLRLRLLLMWSLLLSMVLLRWQGLLLWLLLLILILLLLLLLSLSYNRIELVYMRLEGPQLLLRGLAGRHHPHQSFQLRIRSGPCSKHLNNWIRTRLGRLRRRLWRMLGRLL